MAERTPFTTRRAVLRLIGSSTALGILGCESSPSASAANPTDAADVADATDVIAMGDSGNAGDATANADLGINEPDVSAEDWTNTEWARGGTAAMVDRATDPDPHTTALPDCAHIVPTTAGGSWEHLRNGRLPWRSALAIGTGALVFGLLFGHLGSLLSGWQLLGLQAAMYGLLALTISPRGQQQDLPIAQLPQPLLGLMAVGAVLALLPPFEGRGIGKELLGRMSRDLAAMGHQRLFLGCSADPTSRSWGFYRHLGWHPTGELDGRGDEILECIPKP